jgi:hypothetical protein
MAIVRDLAKARGVRVAFMPLLEPVDIFAAARIDPTDRRGLPPPAVRPLPSCPF